MHKLWIIGLVSCTLLLSADVDEETFGLKNGRFWSTLATEETAIFLVGMVDGWKLREHTEEAIPGKVILVWNATAPFKYSELANMVGLAYANPENMSLPIGWVVMACLAVQRGDTARDPLFEALRKHLTDLRSRPGTFYTSDISPVDVILKLKKK